MIIMYLKHRICTAFSYHQALTLQPLQWQYNANISDSNGVFTVNQQTHVNGHCCQSLRLVCANSIYNSHFPADVIRLINW